MLQEFKDFIMKGNLIDLAIAVVLATFFAPVVSAIVNGVVLNLLAGLIGKPNFDSVARIKISDANPEAGFDPEDATKLAEPATYLEFGTVITAVVTFVIVGFVCFLIVKAYNKMAKRGKEEAGPSEVDLLTEIRDSLANR
jgi:large conductance mechanosensitive channel